MTFETAGGVRPADRALFGFPHTNDAFRAKLHSVYQSAEPCLRDYPTESQRVAQIEKDSGFLFLVFGDCLEQGLCYIAVNLDRGIYPFIALLRISSRANCIEPCAHSSPQASVALIHEDQ